MCQFHSTGHFFLIYQTAQLCDQPSPHLSLSNSLACALRMKVEDLLSVGGILVKIGLAVINLVKHHKSNFSVSQILMYNSKCRGRVMDNLRKGLLSFLTSPKTYHFNLTSCEERLTAKLGLAPISV
jgi:hypothetical protein